MINAAYVDGLGMCDIMVLAMLRTLGTETENQLGAV